MVWHPNLQGMSTVYRHTLFQSTSTSIVDHCKHQMNSTRKRMLLPCLDKQPRQQVLAMGLWQECRATPASCPELWERYRVSCARRLEPSLLGASPASQSRPCQSVTDARGMPGAHPTLHSLQQAVGESGRQNESVSVYVMGIDGLAQPHGRFHSQRIRFVCGPPGSAQGLSSGVQQGAAGLVDVDHVSQCI